MIRFYISNHSYPELREVTTRWQRHVIWWRAIQSAIREPRFQRFLAFQVLLVACWIFSGILAVWFNHLSIMTSLSMSGAVSIAATITWSILALSWGGDLMRPHMRRVSTTARDACPECGHLLTGHLLQAEQTIRCPECGMVVPRRLFQPPYEIPPEFRAIRPRPRCAA